MYWQKLTLTLTVAGMAAVLALTGCTGAKESTEAAAPAAEQTAPQENEAKHYISADGNFQVVWPSGCDKLRIRSNEPEYFVGEDESTVILVHSVICDREGETGEGCSVTATFEAKSKKGGEADAHEVLARVRNTLSRYGVTVVKQMPVKREFADGLIVEGVDVYGLGKDGVGQFWVRGLLAYHDIYLLTAWSVKGDLWENPAYQRFFNEFVPYAE